jgi:hypothetical protein
MILDSNIHTASLNFSILNKQLTFQIMKLTVVIPPSKLS